jgi:organic radical activating enzyme
MGFEKDLLIYWDIRSNEIKCVNGIKVLEPFGIQYPREKTLIINCIPNGSLSGSVGKSEFAAKGYEHYLSGMALFESLVCKMTAEKGFDAKVCIETTFCNWCACKRLPSLLNQQCKKSGLNKFSDEMVYPLATFAINQKCTLSCSHCGQYINHYENSARENFSLERIRADIDHIFDAVDAIGYVSIIGGEPFIHPDLADIVNYVLTKGNFGVIGITTNGICDLDEQLLKILNNGKTRIIFSDYTDALSDNQRKLFEKNVKKVSDFGISYTVGKPLWSTPPSLRKLNLSENKKIAMKEVCNSRVTCKTIQNGVYYPCSTTAGMGSHKLADFQNDWVVFDENDTAEELRAKIRHVDEQPYYESCDHCGEGGEMLGLAGEQGVSQRYIHILDISKSSLDKLKGKK